MAVSPFGRPVQPFEPGDELLVEAAHLHVEDQREGREFGGRGELREMPGVIRPGPTDESNIFGVR